MSTHATGNLNQGNLRARAVKLNCHLGARVRDAEIAR